MSEKNTSKNVDPGKIAAAYDAAEFLRTPEDIEAYLEAIFEDYGSDSRVVIKALGDVARAQGMQKVAKATGLNREGLYKALSGTGNPSFETVSKVMAAVGMTLKPVRRVRAVRRKAKPRATGKAAA
jgi:probable addiction module antidote protein